MPPLEEARLLSLRCHIVLFGMKEMLACKVADSMTRCAICSITFSVSARVYNLSAAINLIVHTATCCTFVSSVRRPKITVILIHIKSADRYYIPRYTAFHDPQPMSSHNCKLTSLTFVHDLTKTSNLCTHLQTGQRHYLVNIIGVSS